MFNRPQKGRGGGGPPGPTSKSALEKTNKQTIEENKSSITATTATATEIY